MTGGWQIELLARRHDRRSFDCGMASLNEFLSLRARQNAEEDISRTYVAIRPASVRVCGFYTICSGSVERQSMPAEAAKRLPKYPVPAVRLARLAVDILHQGQGLGGDLVLDVLQRVQRLADEVGIRAVIVDALDERARRFYLRFGFQSLLDDDLHLFLPMATIRQLTI